MTYRGPPRQAKPIDVSLGLLPPWTWSAPEAPIVRRDVIRYTRNIICVDSDERRMTRREYSAALFGNRFVAEVVAAIQWLAPAHDSAVTTRMVASRTGLSDSLVRPVMRRLAEAGLLVPTERTGGPRSTLRYQIRREPLWSAVTEMCAILGGDSAAD